MKGLFSMPVCARKQKTRAFLQPAATAAMHCHTPGDTRLPLPVPPFLLVQNLSSKWIAPNDNIQPNFNDDYSCH